MNRRRQSAGLGVLVNPDLTVNVAGGFLIEVLPFASDACIDTIENNLKNLPPVTTMMSQGMTPDQIALRLLDGLEPNLLDEGEVKYQCDCSRERTERVLKALGNTELSKLAEEGEPITVNCHFCGKEYKFTPDELQKALQRRGRITGQEGIRYHAKLEKDCGNAADYGGLARSDVAAFHGKWNGDPQRQYALCPEIWRLDLR